jgi:hypothetical protein
MVLGKADVATVQDDAVVVPLDHLSRVEQPHNPIEVRVAALKLHLLDELMAEIRYACLENLERETLEILLLGPLEITIADDVLEGDAFGNGDLRRIRYRPLIEAEESSFTGLR